MSQAPTATPTESHTMQCMEVWGGFGVSDNGVVMPGLDVWVFSRPYEDSEAGGDVHYVSSCGTGRISRLLVADVSGHGAKVATIAKDLRDLMRRYVNFVDQRVFVERLNGSFVELTKSGLFATAVVATFFAPSQTLTVTNAGHPRPLLYSRERKSWRQMSEEAGADEKSLANLPLGMFEETVYPNVTLQASRGDIVVIYSDSLIEAPLEEKVGGKTGRLLGADGLLEVVQSVPVEPTQTLATRLYAAVLAKSAPGTRTLGDDVTILVLRPNGAKEVAPYFARVWAGVKFVGMAARSLVGGPAAPWPEMSRENILGAVIRKFAGGYARGAERI
jgi:hypothetical protein